MARRGMHGRGGMHGGGHAWQGGACMAGWHTRPAPGIYYEIRSTSGQYASYWNAYLFNLKLVASVDSG